jgi:hypothetical protein
MLARPKGDGQWVDGRWAMRETTGDGSPIAPSLLRDIEASLKYLLPLSVMENLALPLQPTGPTKANESERKSTKSIESERKRTEANDTNRSKREAALQTLAQLVEESQHVMPPSDAIVTSEYLKRAISLLTAGEVVSLLPWSEVAEACLKGREHFVHFKEHSVHLGNIHSTLGNVWSHRCIIK